MNDASGRTPRADPGLYDYWPYDSRPTIRWPNGARIALWIAPNIEFYEYAPPPNPQRKPWPRPLPDVLGYAARDYEFFSHGIYNTRYTYGLDEAQEREMIEESMALIQRHTGQHCDGYLAPALSHSESTIDLFAEAGGAYTCDLFHDDQPTPVHTRSGKRFVSVPYPLELNDTITYVVNKIEPRRYGRMIKDAFDRLYAEGEHSGTVMCVPLHAYQVSQPHRIKHLERVFDHFAAHTEAI